MTYDPRDDAFKSYEAAIEAIRKRIEQQKRAIAARDAATGGVI